MVEIAAELMDVATTRPDAFMKFLGKTFGRLPDRGSSIQGATAHHGCGQMLMAQFIQELLAHSFTETDAGIDFDDVEQG
jgi:hypothetical protein